MRTKEQMIEDLYEDWDYVLNTIMDDLFPMFRKRMKELPLKQIKEDWKTQQKEQEKEE
jgi:hypothetical protein